LRWCKDHTICFRDCCIEKSFARDRNIPLRGGEARANAGIGNDRHALGLAQLIDNAVMVYQCTTTRTWIKSLSRASPVLFREESSDRQHRAPRAPLSRTMNEQREIAKRSLISLAARTRLRHGRETPCVRPSDSRKKLDFGGQTRDGHHLKTGRASKKTRPGTVFHMYL
jgi:hypothetical protein